MTGLEKSLALHIKSAGAPTDEQLSAIRRYTLADIPAEKLYVRTFALAHNAIDRDDEAFDASALADFARTLPGKGLFVKHPSGWDGDSGPGKGRFFSAELQHMTLDEARKLLDAPALQWPPGETTATLLMGSAYMVRTAGNGDLLDEIDAGIACFVSLGFGAKRGGNLIDENGRELTSRRLTSPAEAYEGSLVWLGAQQGARAIKNAPRNEETDMVTQKDVDDANAKATDFENKLKAAQPSHDIVLKAREKLGDDAHLIEKPDDLAAAVKAGKAYADSLIDTIVASERKNGLCGDSEEEVSTAKALYAGFPLEKLKQLAARAGATPAPAMQPSDPNAPKEKGSDATATKGAPAVFADAPLI